MQNQMSDSIGIAVNGNIDIYDGEQFRTIAGLEGSAEIALYDCSPNLGEQRVYSPNNPPPSGMIIDSPTTFNIPMNFSDIYSVLDYLKNYLIRADITIQFEDGIYNIDEPISIPPMIISSNVFINIQGNSSDKSAVTIKTNSNVDAFYLDGISNKIKIAYLTIDGNNMGMYGINSTHSSGALFIENCDIKNFVSVGIGTDGSTGLIYVNDPISISNCQTGILLLRNGQLRLNANMAFNNCSSRFIYLSHGSLLSAVSNISVSMIGPSATAIFTEYLSMVNFPSNTVNMSGSITAAVNCTSSSYVQLVGGTVVGTFSPAINTVGNYNSFIRR